MPINITIPTTHQERPKHVDKEFVPKTDDAAGVQAVKGAGVFITNKAGAAKAFLSKYTVFHIRTDCDPGGSVEVLKRYSDFKAFDATWTKLYPSVHEMYQLPRPDVRSFVMKNSPDVVRVRQLALQEYLQGLIKINALRDLLAQFLEVPEPMWKGALVETRQKRHSLSEHIKLTKTKDDVKGPPGSGESKVRILSAAEVQAMKGNNMEANQQALKAKQEFMDKHKGVLDALMPGHSLNLPMSVSSVKQDHKRLSLGQLRVNVFYLVATSTLHVEIEEAKDLPALSTLMHENPTTDSYVKVYLKPDPEKTTKRKTKVVKQSLNPIFHENFEYKLTTAELAAKQIEISVWGKGSASVSGVGLGESLGYLFFPGASITQVVGASKPEAKLVQLQPPPEVDAVVVSGSVSSSPPVSRVTSSPSSPTPRSASPTPGAVSPSASWSTPSSPSSSSSSSSGYASPAASPTPKAAAAAPPPPVKKEEKGRVVESYTPTAEEAESAIDLKEGEVVTVIDSADSVWWYGRDSRGKEGYFPADCVVLLKPSPFGGPPPPR